MPSAEDTKWGGYEMFTEENAMAIQRLAKFDTAVERLEELCVKYPANKIAAVLVLLFEKEGVLRVVLTTRSKTLRSHPGQTALPGGKCEPKDGVFLRTALREASEECGLDPGSPCLEYVTQLPRFLSQWKIIVVPVVVICKDPTFIDTLIPPSTDEVALVFSHPLEAILDPSIARREPLTEKGGPDWPYEEELYNTTDSTWAQIRSTVYRMHRFRTSASPIKGLTSDILIMVAEIAFGKPMVHPRYAQGQASQAQLAQWAIEDYARDGFITPAKPPVLEAAVLRSREEESIR